MFCPKCGNELPDNAKFCVKCGAQLQARVPQAQQAPQVAKPLGAASFKQTSLSPHASNFSNAAGAASASVAGVFSSFTPLGLAARIVAVITLICMFLPWAGVPALSTINSYASMLGVGSVAASDYTILGLGNPVNTLSSLIGKNSIQGAYTVFLIMWLAGSVLLAAGLITSLIGKRKHILLALGCIVAAAVALIWALFVMAVNSSNNYEILSVAGGCIGTIVLGVIGFVLALAGRVKA